DVQWMTAGNGILHKEYHEENFSKKGGVFQMVQLWINLPAEAKKSKPKYHAITAGDIAKHPLDNQAGTIEEVAGEYRGTKGPSATIILFNKFNDKLNKGGRADYSFPPDYTKAMIVIERSMQVKEKDEVPTDHFVLFENKGE